MTRTILLSRAHEHRYHRRMTSFDPIGSLNIVSVGYPDSEGRLGLCACPGRKLGGLVTRDLTADLQTIRDWGARHLVTLIEDHEFTLCGVEELPAAAARHDLVWHHLPIIDGAAPGSRFEHSWRETGPVLHRHLRSGGRIVIHCLGGIGRSGTVAVRMLMERAVPFDHALATVRRVRPGAVESPEQRAYLAADAH